MHYAGLLAYICFCRFCSHFIVPCQQKKAPSKHGGGRRKKSQTPTCMPPHELALHACSTPPSYWGRARCTDDGICSTVIKSPNRGKTCPCPNINIGQPPTVGQPIPHGRSIIDHSLRSCCGVLCFNLAVASGHSTSPP